ncbi:hypothetical protein AXG93_872s1110 [Marchantia polymorpha subsp. ruderalis]|uniref:Uncharacterized protein n=1 Tax=Marchantia polymorpha subsp. ruderalis TaxID=1480154 RepID=A0A176VLE1_MARPO|nr:hypothetical protein AXG93_872s1110 [Marchantia polymorpha subsp. ruderalis]
MTDADLKFRSSSTKGKPRNNDSLKRAATPPLQSDHGLPRLLYLQSRETNLWGWSGPIPQRDPFWIGRSRNRCFEWLGSLASDHSQKERQSASRACAGRNTCTEEIVAICRFHRHYVWRARTPRDVEIQARISAGGNNGSPGARAATPITRDFNSSLTESPDRLSTSSMNVQKVRSYEV